MNAGVVVAATVLSYAVAVALGVPLLVPVLNTLASYPVMVVALRRGRMQEALSLMLVWALAMGCTPLVHLPGLNIGSIIRM